MQSSPFNSYNISWKIGDHIVTDAATDERYKNEDLVHVRYPLPASIGAGGFTSLKLASGLSLHHSAFEFNTARYSEPLTASVQVDLKEPCLLVQSVLVGGMNRRDHIKGRCERLEPGATLLQWVNRTEADLTFDLSPRVETIYVHASQSALNLLLGQELTSHLRCCVQTSDNRQFLPTAVTAPLRFCFDDRLDGAVHKLHAQNKTLEFLERLIRYFDEIGAQRPASQPFSAALLMEYLQKRPGQLPSARHLASLFGVSVSIMNDMFIAECGMSVAAFMREQRMAFAHESLTSSNLTVAEISAQLGYTHVSNFSAAFKAFYGYSPTGLRKSAMSSD